MREFFAKVNGINICYDVHGKGYPLLLIHGFGSKKESFMFQVGALSKKFKVIRIDNRGAGKSDRPNEPYNIDIIVKDIKELMDHLKIERAHILGYSLGGMIVQQFALNYSHKIEKLILINTLPYNLLDDSALDNYVNIRIKKYKTSLKDPVKAFFDNASLGYTFKFRKWMQENPKRKIHGIFSAEDIINIGLKNAATPQDILNQKYSLKNFNVLDKLHNIKNETLIICASRDKITPKSINYEIHEAISGSKFITVNKAGHFSTIERAPEINQYILDFLL